MLVPALLQCFLALLAIVAIPATGRPIIFVSDAGNPGRFHIYSSLEFIACPSKWTQGSGDLLAGDFST